MSHYELEWTTKDGLKIYAQGWEPEAPAKAVICLVHGLGEHSGRYGDVATYLNQAGYTVLAYDLRGHGRTEGKRGHATFDQFATDTMLLLQKATERYPGLPRFLYGHSLGGIIVLDTGLRYQPEIAGVVATSSGLRTALEQQRGKILLIKIMGNIAPTFSTPSGLDAQALSHDPQVVEKYIKDPLVHGMVSAAFGKNALVEIPWIYQHASEWKLPLLLMHGSEDRIAFVEGSQQFAKLVPGDCTLKVWEGFYHETHNEPEKEQVLAYLCGWLDSHLPHKA